MIPLSDHEFTRFQRFIHEAAGITLTASKKPLVSGRLAKRLAHYGLGSYAEYFTLISSGRSPEEAQTAVDLLTTNETYFFREPQHFTLLREQALQARGRADPFRVWSAACSSGEEAYSIAMVLADSLGAAAWEVVGTDVSMRMLHAAACAHYPMARTTHLPPAYLRRFCLKGMGEQAGTLLIERSLRARVRFRQANLNAPLPELGMFDLIFLRNVMIYFSDDTKRAVVARLLPLLRAGGHFLIGHAESLNGISEALSQVAPSIYRKL
jgi:chemotaxis protein methyltransferase CheR